jgi:hypothetical protein
MGALGGPLSTYDRHFDVRVLSEGIAENAFPVAKRAPATKIGGSPWLQQGSLSPVVIEGESGPLWERRTSLTAEELAALQTPQGIVDLNREGIEMALDRRVGLFFQQSILCHNMPLTFSAKGADDQIGTSAKVRLSQPEGKGKVYQKREAAHSSTIPTLLATTKDGQKRTFVYLKGGSSHAQHNATIGMHVHVNGADELLDGKGDKGLRSTAVKILNQVAGGLDPVAATKKFLKEFEKSAKAAAKDLDAQDARKAVLKAYVEGIRDIAHQVEIDPTIFDRLIGVQIDPDDPKEKVLREIVYQRRYDIIRFEEEVESSIGKLIADAKQKMGIRDRSFLEYMLLKEFADTPQRKVLEKLFAKTAEIFEDTYADGLSTKEKRSLKSFHTRVEKLREKYAKLLSSLSRDLRSDFKTLSSSEFAYRAQVFKDLRTRVRDWTQKEFCEHYHETTGKKVSQAWVSRMEQPTRVDTKDSYQTPLSQRMRRVSLEDVQDCAVTFGVDVGLLLPCLITS